MGAQSDSLTSWEKQRTFHQQQRQMALGKTRASSCWGNFFVSDQKHEAPMNINTGRNGD